MTLREARLPKNRTRINYDGVRDLLGKIKSMMRKELNPEVKDNLAQAGIALSKILLK